MSEEPTRDVRQTPPAQSHPLIFQTFEALQPSGAGPHRSQPVREAGDAHHRRLAC